MRKIGGFTLIEMMIAVSVIVMITSVGVASYGGFNKRQRAKATRDRIMQVFREARGNALSGKKDCYECGGADHLCNGSSDDARLLNWEVKLDTTDNSVTLRGVCQKVSPPTGPEIKMLERKEIMAVTPAGPCNNMNFLPDGTVNVSGPGCTVTASGGGENFTVTVYPSGVIDSN